MASIEVQSPQEKAQIIMVHEGPSTRNNAAEAHRYFEEANNADLPEHIAEAKRDTARFLAQLAFEDRKKEYAGEKPPTSR